MVLYLAITVFRTDCAICDLRLNFSRKVEYKALLSENCFSVNTLNGRVKLSYFAEGMSKYFNHSIYKFGTARLVNKHGKYYLHIPVTYEIEESNISDICNVVGID